ncbi:hypothetical protein SprV_0200582600 [Sparganum proliferum]
MDANGFAIGAVLSQADDNRIEAVFSTSRITSERTRYSYVVQSLSFDVAVDVDDLLDPIPANDSYTQLNTVIQRVAKSANRMLRELFTQVELGDQTPSQLMRHMRSLLAGRHMDEAIFRQIWLDKLPVPMQQVLAMLGISISLDKMANHADRINECLRNAAQSFQRFIDEVLCGLSFTHVYIDDILVASSSAEEHASQLRQIIDRFEQQGLQLNVDKCVSGVTFLDFLGHRVDQRGIIPLTEKMQSILSFPVPKTLTQLRRFIGFINYYRRPTPHCAATMAPMTDLLKSKATPIELSSAAHTAFETAKKALADANVLHHLSSDPYAQLILTTDASNSVADAVLHRRINNQLQPFAFFTQKLRPAQTCYCTFSRERLVIYLATRHFRHLLEGRDFRVHADHKPLTHILKAKPDRYSTREVRHLDYIPQSTSDIRYVRSCDNVVADALSRPDINSHTSNFHLAKLAEPQSADKSIADLPVTVEDLLDPIPADEPYMRLKEVVIQRVAKSANLMLRELFTQIELGDQTPSQLMRHMRSLLAGRHMDDAIFREIWLEKLPVPMQQVLAMSDSNIPLEKLATHADRIKECYPIGASCSNIRQPPPSKGKPHQGIDFDLEGPALSEHDTPYTEKAPCCCTTRRASTSAGPPRTPTDAYRTDYDDLRDTVCLLCTQVSNMCSALNSLQSARKQPYSHRRSKSLKRPRQPIMATTAAGPSRPSRLFYINDKSNDLHFLVDTGAEVSVIPPLRRHRLKPSQFSLQAANSTTVSTYGQWSLTLDLGLRRRFQWVVIEADFLSYFGLTVDVRHRRLTDTTTQLFTIDEVAEKDTSVNILPPEEQN